MVIILDGIILWLEADESMQTVTAMGESLRALADNVIGGRVAHTDQAVIVSADGTRRDKAVLWLKYYQIHTNQGLPRRRLLRYCYEYEKSS